MDTSEDEEEEEDWRMVEDDKKGKKKSYNRRCRFRGSVSIKSGSRVLGESGSCSDLDTDFLSQKLDKKIYFKK